MCRLKAFSYDLNELGYAASLFCLEGMYKIRVCTACFSFPEYVGGGGGGGGGAP